MGENTWWPLSGFFLGAQPPNIHQGIVFLKQLTPNGHQFKLFFGIECTYWPPC